MCHIDNCDDPIHASLTRGLKDVAEGNIRRLDWITSGSLEEAFTLFADDSLEIAESWPKEEEI